MDPLVQGFSKSLAMTVLSEIGDNTFLAAAILAMRHPRRPVFLGCLSATIVMTIVSAVVGWAAPNLVSRKWAHHITTLLFFVFGMWSLKDAIFGEGEDELAEVEEKLDADSKANSGTMKDSNKDELAEVEEKLDADSKANSGTTKDSNKSKDDDDLKKQKRPLFSQFFSPIFLKAFSIVFFCEWGDRSQLATIGLAADASPLAVVLGGILGQALCTATAVVGGKGLASRIPERIVALLGGILFIVFGMQSFLSPIEE